MDDIAALREAYRKDIAAWYGRRVRQMSRSAEAELVASGVAGDVAGLLAEAATEMVLQELANANFRGPL